MPFRPSLAISAASSTRWSPTRIFLREASRRSREPICSTPRKPGRYAIVMQKIDGKDPITLTLILQEMAGAWKLAGYYPRLDSIGGHDGQWYLAKAREFKAKGQTHNAWFYYLTAWDLMAPVNFMSTPQLD